MATKQPRYFWMSYMAPESVLARGKRGAASIADSMHMERDGAAFAYAQALVGHGREFGGILFQIPARLFGGLPHKPRPDVRAGDLVVLATRPPLHDDLEDKRRIAKSGTETEACVHAALARVFEYCSRSTIIVADGLAEQNEHRALAFQVNKKVKKRVPDQAEPIRSVGPTLVGWGCMRKPADLPRRGELRDPRTAGYLVYLPRIRWLDGREGPDLLVMFGLAGTETMIWNRLIQTRRRDEVRSLLAKRSPRLLVELFEAGVPTAFVPSDLSFVDAIETEPLLDVPLP